MAQSVAKETGSNGANLYGNLSTSCNDFTYAFYKELTFGEKGNGVSSPLSVHMTLSLLSHGAEGETLQELTNTLYHRDIEALNKDFKSLISALNEIKNVKLYLANALYIQDEFKVLEDFLSIGTNIFRSEVSTLNFKENVNAAEKINAWVKQATENKITDLASQDDFDEDTKLVLVNAIYFKGSWLHSFLPSNTHDRTFHTTKTMSKQVPTMFREAYFACGELPDLNAEFVELPYSNTDIVMTIILPNEVDGLAYLQKNFKWETLVNAPRDGCDVQLYLPRFKFETKIDLENVLRKIGLNIMFEDNADFSRMSDVPLKVSKVVHKAVIEINEQGTEAAAATQVVMRLRRMIVTPKQFDVKHPFMFIIEHKPSKLPLFLGHVWDIETTPVKDEL